MVAGQSRLLNGETLKLYHKGRAKDRFLWRRRVAEDTYDPKKSPACPVFEGVLLLKVAIPI